MIDDDSGMRAPASRRILVLAHMGRPDARVAAEQTLRQLADSGVEGVLTAEDREAMSRAPELGELPPVGIVPDNCALSDIELVVVLGGDGSILRAAEVVRDVGVPLLGVNLGHVGFLAESERAGLAETVQAVVDGRYTVEERMALDVRVWHAGRPVLHTWALNEASVEKGDREKMLEVVTEVDRRPLSSFGCDGVIMATPTGSTAYAFSAGGPVVWPEVEALLMVPLSPHALFSRPLVVSPSSMIAVEVLTRTDARGVLWCDGRRTVELPPGSRIEVTRAEQPVTLARMHRTPFSERLVKKFGLPTAGWRGPVEQDEISDATSTLPIVQPDYRTTIRHQEPGMPQHLSVGQEIPQDDQAQHRAADPGSGAVAPQEQDVASSPGRKGER